jgi:hypothetical protein
MSTAPASPPRNIAGSGRAADRRRRDTVRRAMSSIRRRLRRATRRPATAVSDPLTERLFKICSTAREGPAGVRLHRPTR